MYCDRRGNGQKSTRTKPPGQKSPRTIEIEFKQGTFVRDFCTRPTKNRRGSEMCDVFSGGGPGMCDKVWQGRGSKLAKNSVPYFMDGPEDNELRPSRHRSPPLSMQASDWNWRNTAFRNQASGDGLNMFSMVSFILTSEYSYCKRHTVASSRVQRLALSLIISRAALMWSDITPCTVCRQQSMHDLIMPRAVRNIR